jgi:uncharacterized membrane protein YcaP (DUF421 family)
MLFDSWAGLLRVLVVGTLAYVSLVLFLRISGNRTLSKLNAFDLVVTVALGSTLATVLLSKDVALLEGLLAFALLIFLQFVVTWISARSGAFANLIKAEPRLLVHEGQLLRTSLRRARITEDEMLAALRSSGVNSVSEARAVVLETDGTLSVLRRSDENSSSLSNVERPAGSGLTSDGPPEGVHPS